jgi:hypothetical protein
MAASLKVALLAVAAAGAFVLLPACGGGGAGGDGNTNTSPGNGSGNGTSGSGTGGTSDSTSGTGGTGSAGTSDNTGSSACTIVGGNLFVAQQGPIAATLVSNGGSTHFFDIQLGYSTCDTNCSNPQRQDAFGFAFTGTPPTFNENTALGTTVTLQPQSGMPINGQMVSTFPQGTPIFLTFGNGDDFSATATDNKDLGHTYPETALVTYSAGSTATVEFRTSAGLDYRVGLTNVVGSPNNGCSL